MKLDLKDLPAKAAAIFQKARHYAPLIFLLSLAAIYGFLVFRIGQLTQSEPSDTAVTEQLQTVKRPKIDKEAIDKIEALEDTNIEVESLFKQARDNPFQE